MKKALASAALAALAASFAAADASAAPAAAPKSSDGPEFASAVPAGWSAARDARVLRLSGPSDENRLTALIVLRWYPPGDKTFSGADAYVKRQTSPSPFDTPGTKTGPVSAARVAGRAARRFVQDAQKTVPPNSLNQKFVPTREEQVVVPGAKGFYVLSYFAPKALFDGNRAAFRAVLAGFKPKL